MDKIEYNKVVIIGATSGIGRELVNLYVNSGAKVGIVARRTELLEELAATSDKIEYVEADIRNSENCIERLERLRHNFGEIDLFILCAGVGWMNFSLDEKIEQDTISTNVVGWTSVIDWIFKIFLQQRHGHLTAITSIASIRGLGPAPSYSATKAFQAHYLEALFQLAKATSFPIYVTNVRPGFVQTPLLAHPEKFFWVAPVQHAARQIMKGISRKRHIVTITRRWKLIALLLQIIPNRLISTIIKRIK